MTNTTVADITVPASRVAAVLAAADRLAAGGLAVNVRLSSPRLLGRKWRGTVTVSESPSTTALVFEALRVAEAA